MEREVPEESGGKVPDGESQLLPMPVTCYLRTGTLTEEHVRQAFRLREFYGLYLLSKPFSKNLCSKGSTFVDSSEAALDVLAEACPEEVSYYIYGMPMPSVEVVDGCRMFANYVSEYGGRVPQWAAAAFWWLSHAVDGSFSADDLAVAIERWHPLIR